MPFQLNSVLVDEPDFRFRIRREKNEILSLETMSLIR